MFFCANDDGSQKDLCTSPATVREILERFRPKEVEYTGGEPTARFPLLLESVRIARQFTDHITINTNMELLNADKLQQLENAGVSHLHFALHALDTELHKKLRGKSFADIEKVKQNLMFALDNTDLKIIVEFVAMKTNMYEFPKVYEYVRGLRDKYGERVVELEVGRLIPKGRAEGGMAPKTTELLPILESIGSPSYPVEVFCFGKENAAKFEKRGFKIFPCDAGSGMFYFKIGGEVLADNFSGIHVADDFREFDLKQFKGVSCPFR